MQKLILIENVSNLLNVSFILITLVTVAQFYKASNNSESVLIILSTWMLLQMVVGLSGFYTHPNTFPPRMVLLAPPAVIFKIILFLTARGKQFIDSLNLKDLTLLHTIRIFVELVLYGLYLAKAVPKIMTFEGSNFDILAGLSAPIVFYFGFVKNNLNKTTLLIWNEACLILLFNIVLLATFSTPTVIQKFGFEQPNIAILYFPFVWLSSVVVPLVLFSHLAAIRQLMKYGSYN